MKQRIAKSTVSLVVFTAGVCSLAPRTVGQISDQISEEDRLRIEAFQERERGMAQDPSPKRPPPDDPSEPDVAKRERFLWELGRRRRDFGCFVSSDMLKEASNDIPEERKVNLLERWSRLLADDLKPVRPGLVQWYGNWGVYADPDAPDGVERRLTMYVAEWSVDDCVVRALQLADSDRYVRVLVRCPKRPSLEFRPMPADFQGYSSDWEFVSKTALDAVLVDFFDLSHAPDGPLRPHGTVTTCAGADVFTETLRSRRGTWAKVHQNADDTTGPSPLGVPDRILITDSDPQYVCVSFDFRSQDRNHR